MLCYPALFFCFFLFYQTALLFESKNIFVMHFVNNKWDVSTFVWRSPPLSCHILYARTLRTSSYDFDIISRSKWYLKCETERRRCTHLCLITDHCIYIYIYIYNGSSAFLSWTLWGSPGMCTHTCTCTSTGTLHRVRGLRARPFSITPPCRQPHSRLRLLFLSPFPENGVCYVRSLPWLKVIRPHTTRQSQFLL